MSVIKISELPLGIPTETDIIPFVDVIDGITKQAPKSSLKGATGSQGNQGYQGYQGTQGIQGNQGTLYPWRGVWDSGTPYVVNDCINYNGSGYVSIQNGTNKQPDTQTTYWNLLVQKGDQGTQGVQGTQGNQGTQGIQGNQGNTGSTGSQGTQGVQGFQGLKGEQGNTGAKGDQGNQGVQGLTGTQGSSGAQGTAGTNGTNGTQGATGTKGDQGFQGNTGSQGSTGTTGSQGTQGDQGLKGDTGSQGVTGTTGSQGSKGDQGYQGYQGNQGNQGTQGLQGLKGDQGFQGQASTIQGSQGNQGYQGNTGSGGSQGNQGYQGYQGNQGNVGTQGNQGTLYPWKGAWITSTLYYVNDCVDNGGSGYVCLTAHTSGTFATDLSNGDWGLLVEKGNQGFQGYQGTQGNQGTQGVQGQASTVQGAQGTQGTQGVQGNQGNQGVQSATPTKASVAEVNTGTDDAKFITPLGLSGSVLFHLQEGGMYNGRILPSVASNNLTVALKTLAGTDPSATDPVYVMIGGVVRSITGALAGSADAGTNYLNMGSAELATKETDLFIYLLYDTTNSAVKMFGARIPYANNISSFVISATNEKGIIGFTYGITWTASDVCVNIGRFAATLSAGAGYTWSVPTFTASNLIQRPIYETRPFTWTPTQSTAGSAYTNAPTIGIAQCQIINNRLVGQFQYRYDATSGGTSASLFTLPFTPTGAFQPGYGANANDTAGVCVRQANGDPAMRITKYDGSSPIANSIWMIIGFNVAI